MSALPPKIAQPTPSRLRRNPRQFVLVVFIVSTILLTANALVCATVSYFFHLPGWLEWQVLPALVPLSFIVTTLLGFRHSNFLLHLVYGISARWLGALSFAFFTSLACWITEGLIWMAGWPWPRETIGSVFAGIALLIACAGLINARWLRTTRVTIQLPNLPEEWQGHTLALITDLHLGHLAGPQFLRRVISRLESLQPDAVLISGDMFDGTTIGLDHLVAPWHEYSAPRGVFYVTGNHDEFAERTIYLNAVQPTGIRILDNEKFTVHGLQLVGIHDSEAGDPEELRRILRGLHLDPQLPSILLAHQPSNLAVAEAEGISLQLSGHTHGGQFWPWTLLVSRLYGRFAHGLNRFRNLQVFTGYGAGTWGPPLRVGTRSEIVLIRLEKAEVQVQSRRE